MLIPQLWHKYQTQGEAVGQLGADEEGQQNGAGTHFRQVDEAQKVEARGDEELQRQCGHQELSFLFKGRKEIEKRVLIHLPPLALIRNRTVFLP